MRARRSRNSATFSLRTLLGFAVGIAILLGLRMYIDVILVMLYCSVLSGVLLVGRIAAAASPKWSAGNPVGSQYDPNSILRILIAAHVLVTYRIWHCFVLMTSTDAGLDYLFGEPIVFGLSIYSLQMVLLLVTEILILTIFVINCLVAGKVDARESYITAGLLAILLLCHLAHPWFIPGLRNFTFWLYAPPLPVE
ncbi:hypothetical protein ETAA8_50910 [Anatilimnocola aggregata]|uniref:Uncharacterized protein n=1 Tax=Anatilimnocola aggregata TaxID=2528021 RepID=A0A517YIB5_9BACT|nr:hypothetical protein [Anatilimnocola aggregata]QDU29973.1 hypothetical protein ETAA8_50910 [Anatilimnocola aggregata]